MSKRTAAERQIRLAVEFKLPDEIRASLQPLLDGRAIQQALVNLIDNALKHSPTGATVTIGLSGPTDHTDVLSSPRTPRPETSDSRPQTANFLHLWVEDHGPGIPPADHERIFERFYRRGSELRRETQGVGLGLAIVKHIVEAHGGRVLVRSAVGEGSRFTLELPMTSDFRKND